MKLLVIGSGGREHALVWKLAKSPHPRKIWCAPGNAGIAREEVAATGERVTCLNIRSEDLQGQLALADQIKPDLVIVGPDNPLALGIVDLFRLSGFRIWGPTRQATRFESSKAFAQEFMERHGIPTARARAFSDASEARKFAEALGGRCAIKADGLALGKGVIVCQDLKKASEAIEQMLVQKVFGQAGERIVIQELLRGTEMSLHLLSDGKSVKLFPVAQDHKRAWDGDTGPNTGGMGAYCPAPFLSGEDLQVIREKIINRWIDGCRAEGISFQGILYPGIMLTEEGPKVIEFNARFGDPEAQVYLTRLENDLVELIETSLRGELEKVELKWEARTTICVVMASAGYPGHSETGRAIRGLEEAANLSQVKVFHAATRETGKEIVTAGGRVLGITAWGNDLREARQRAYEAADKIQFDGAQFRHDIGNQGLQWLGRSPDGV